MQQIAVSGKDQIRDTKEITMAWPCFETRRTSAWNTEGRMRGKPTRGRIKSLIWQRWLCCTQTDSWGQRGMDTRDPLYQLTRDPCSAGKWPWNEHVVTLERSNLSSKLSMQYYTLWCCLTVEMCSHLCRINCTCFRCLYYNLFPPLCFVVDSVCSDSVEWTCVCLNLVIGTVAYCSFWS